MQQVEDLYVINVEGVENVGKTTLLNHIKKKIADNGIGNIDASHKFPTSECGDIMSKVVETISLLKKDINKYLDKLKDCKYSYNSIREAFATIIYELLMGVSYQYEKLAEINIRDQYDMIYNSIGGENKSNSNNIVIINDRGVLSAFYLNYCEKYYYEALAKNIYIAITNTIPFCNSFIEEPFDPTIIDKAKKKSEDWVTCYIDEIYFRFSVFVINTMKSDSTFDKDYNDFKAHYHNLTLLLNPNDEFINSSGETEESITYKAFFDSDKEQIRRSHKFLNSLLSTKGLQENDPIPVPGISYIENIDIYMPDGTRKSPNRILQDLCCSKILEETRPDVQLLLSQLLKEEI